MLDRLPEGRSCIRREELRRMQAGWVLEVDMSGELVVARRVGDAGDGAEGGRSRRPACTGTAEHHIVPGVQAVGFKLEGQVLVDREGAAQACVEIPGMRISQTQGCCPRRIPDQILGRTGWRDVLRSKKAVGFTYWIAVQPVWPGPLMPRLQVLYPLGPFPQLPLMRPTVVEVGIQVRHGTGPGQIGRSSLIRTR